MASKKRILQFISLSLMLVAFFKVFLATNYEPIEEASFKQRFKSNTNFERYKANAPNDSMPLPRLDNIDKIEDINVVLNRWNYKPTNRKHTQTDRENLNKNVEEENSVYKTSRITKNSFFNSNMFGNVGNETVNDILGLSINIQTSQHGAIYNCITGDMIGQFTSSTDQNFNNTKINDFETVEERKRSFKRVFETRAWGHGWDPSNSGLNASGMGSTLQWTQEYMGTLHVVLNYVKQYLGKEKLHVLDVPCGDFAWMSRFLKTRQDIIYTGIDIVPDLIDHHRETFGGFRDWRFITADILDPGVAIDDYDVIMNRMMLQHLYFSDIEGLLDKFSQSGSSFILLTTFPSHTKNKELTIEEHNPGRFRFLNLELPPVSLSPPLCLQRDGPLDAFQGWDHFVGLWRLPLSRVSNCHEDMTYSYRIRDTPVHVHTCTNVIATRQKVIEK